MTVLKVAHNTLCCWVKNTRKIVILMASIKRSFQNSFSNFINSRRRVRWDEVRQKLFASGRPLKFLNIKFPASKVPAVCETTIPLESINAIKPAENYHMNTGWPNWPSGLTKGSLRPA